MASVTRARTAAAPSRAPKRRPAPAPARPDLRIVPRPRVRRRARLVGALTVIVVFGALFGAVVFSTWVVQAQQRLDALDDRVTVEQSRYQELRLEVARLESPERIVAEATQRLGMVPPPGTTYLVPAPTDAATAAAGTLAGATDDAEQSEGAAAADWPEVKPYLGGAG